MEQHHTFTDPRSQREFVLLIGDTMSDTGVIHGHVGSCEVLADVSPDLDCAYCPACGWQCRLSGAWFMDLWRAAHPAVSPEERLAAIAHELENGGAWATDPDDAHNTLLAIAQLVAEEA